MKTSDTNFINRFASKRILVIGDFILDIYLRGISTRLCPEAPVPVVDITERSAVPGGAANTVCNLKALGATVAYCTVIGADHEGDVALSLLAEMNVSTDNIIRSPERTTITKSRIVAGPQVITRIDQGCEDPINREAAQELKMAIKKSFHDCDAIIISDYNKGVITTEVLDTLVILQAQHQKFIAVDSKRLDFFSSLQPSLAKPNYEEAIRLFGGRHQFENRSEQIREAAGLLYEKTRAYLICITLDKEGSVVIQNGNVVCLCEAPSVASPHVAGAGDTYLSAFVLSYLNSDNAPVSAEVATAAATIAVNKTYTSTCSLAELKTYFNMHTKIITNQEDLKELCDGYRMRGKRIVFTNGCFDILHSGHVAYLRCAKDLGDVLIVGMNTDESIKRIKGPDRPINPMADRLQVLAGLASVDHIIPFGHEFDDTPIPLINTVRPHIFAKGGDYTREKLPEGNTVEACGGEIVFLDHIPGHSTTRIINRISLAANLER